MNRTVKILIVDPDRFFVAGLQHAIKAHFQVRDIPVLFMGHPLSYPLADLIFWAPGYTRTEMPIGLLAGPKRSRIILLMSQQRPHLVTCESQVFYRHQSYAHLLSLLNQSINAVVGPTVSDEYATLLATLSPRQFEVMCYLSKGLTPNDIARRLHIHEKTVSSHKRSAMRRLQLSRTIDLHHWILCNPIVDTTF